MKVGKRYKFLTSLVTTLAISASVIAPSSTYAEPVDNNFSLTIMHMNDTHAHADKLPNMLTAINEVRAVDPNALLFNAGDVFSGTLYFNQFKGEADLKLLNLMNIDAMIFGNHEFDLGSSENGHESLSKFVKEANFPFLATNVDFSGDSFMNPLVSDTFTEAAEDSKVYDGMVKVIDGEKVGIFGLTTEDTANISSPVNVKFLDYITEAQKAVDAFEEMGVNKIIAVSHLGYDSNPALGNDLELAKYVDGIDVIVGGHSHTQLNEPVKVTQDETGTEKDPTIVVQAYQYATLLGELKVEFDANGVVVEEVGQLIDLTKKAADQEALNVLAPYQSDVDAISKQESGAIAQKTITNPRLTDSTVSVRANETELGNLVTDAMLTKAKEKNPNVVIAVQNGGGIRAAIAEGPITTGEIIAVLPFGNDPAVVELTGAEIKQLLEHSVRLAPQESGGFLQVAGMKFTYDSTKEAGSRVVSMQVKVNDTYEEINADQKYLVTTNNYTAKGGDGFEVFAKAYQEGRVQDLGEIDWVQFRDYMVGNLGGEVNPTLEGRIVDLLGAEPTPETPEDPADDDQDDTNPTPPVDQDGDSSGNDNGGNNTGNGTNNGTNNDSTNNNTTNNGSTNGNTNKNQNTNTGKVSGSDTTTKTTTVGNALPNTATNMYTMLVVGAVLLVAGLGVVLYRKKVRYS